MPHKRPTCPVCGIRCGASEPVAWSVGRERIHETCIDRARWAALEKASSASWKGPAVRHFLQRAGGPLCAGCLALALRVSLEEVREVMRGADGAAGLQVMAVRCDSCARTIDALSILPASS
jgi:hypothetical protein